jgi:nitroimidazol reductase NimA-like FMN-containing flavoprotein (pyridoxamine 5'-phosphate oxidase superfamily)
MTSEARRREQRRADTVTRLETDAELWVATAHGDQPHLIPLSFAWDGFHIILATPSDSLTARNSARSGIVRLALGTARDVTIFDTATEVVPCRTADAELAETYRRRVGWDPRDEEVEHSFVIATPMTTRAWRNVHELEGRTIMRDGQWLDA